MSILTVHGNGRDLLQEARDLVVNQSVAFLPVKVAVAGLHNLAPAHALGLLHQELEAWVENNTTVNPRLQRVKIRNRRLAA